MTCMTHALKSVNSEILSTLANLSSSELKKLRNKQRRAERRAEANKEEEKKREHQNQQRNKDKNEDLENRPSEVEPFSPQKLARVIISVTSTISLKIGAQ